jgi:WhiB family transcriptional regulator, redox-sensing transcriptional regulator
MAETEVIDMDWRDRAACCAVDPELFFPVGSTGPALDQLADAKSVCHRCPVIGECLAWALGTDQRSGVWGGLSEAERYQLHQLHRTVHARTCLISVRRGTGVPAGVRPHGTRHESGEPSVRNTGS